MKYVWEENIGSLEGALRLYGENMLRFVVQCLGSETYEVTASRPTT